MLHRLAKIINQLMQLFKDTAVNQPVDTACPPTSAIDKRQPPVDGDLTNIAGDVNTEGGMVSTGEINTDGGGIAAAPKSKAGGAGSFVADTIHIGSLHIQGPYLLHELSAVTELVKWEIENVINQIDNSSISKEENLALGLLRLDHGVYKRAIQSFEKVHNSNPRTGQPLYYLTLARIGAYWKKSPGIYRQLVREMEDDLSYATQMPDAQPHYWYLWALIKHEYYERLNFRMDAPCINKLLASGNELFAISTNKEALLGEIKQMQKHVKDTDGFIDKHILDSI